MNVFGLVMTVSITFYIENIIHIEKMIIEWFSFIMNKETTKKTGKETLNQ